MAAPYRDPTVTVTPTNPPPPPPPISPSLDPSISNLNGVLEFTSLNSVGGQPAQLTNLSQSNIIANTNRSAQNAVANQQAHAQLAISVLGKAVNKVQNLGPLESRSSFDVLTDNAVADEIASLKAVITGFSGGGVGPVPPIPPANWAALLKALQRLAREIAYIEAVNARLSGTGTENDPYVITEGPLFVSAPITLGFPGWLPSQVKFQIDELRVNVSG